MRQTKIEKMEKKEKNVERSSSKDWIEVGRGRRRSCDRSIVG